MAEIAEFEFENEQWQSFLKKINLKWKDIENRKEFSNLASIVAFGDIIEHFEEERGPDGKWKPWSKMWAQRRELMGRGSGKILQLTGRLRGSLFPDKGRSKPNNLGVLLYTNVVYAAAHQYGTDKLPARPFMWLSNKGMERLVSVTEKWLTED